MKLTILGSGGVKGAPVYGCNCKACYRAKINSSHRRNPTCAFIEADGFRLLIDAGLPNLCERFSAGQITHVLLTHFHMDHVQGLFQIRWGEGLTIHVIGPDDPSGCDDLLKHPGILDFSRKTRAFDSFDLGPLRITPLPMNHSKLTHGYFIENGSKRLAYLTDTCGIDDNVKDFLCNRQADLLVVDCNFPPQQVPPRNHNDLSMALDIHHGILAKKTLLTHLGHQMDSWLSDHASELPQNVDTAADNMVIRI